MAGFEDIKGKCGMNQNLPLPTGRQTVYKDAEKNNYYDDREDAAFKNKLRMAQNAHTSDLNKDPIETYAEALSRLYFALNDTLGKMDTALKGAIGYPAELSQESIFEVRGFLKEADVLIESGFELFVKFSDK